MYQVLRRCKYLRCIGNLLHCLASKAFTRAVAKQQKPSDAALTRLRDAMQSAKDNLIEVPAAIQALATKYSAGA